LKGNESHNAASCECSTCVNQRRVAMHMYGIATELLEAASPRLGNDLGVTIIVHAAQLKPGDGAIATTTTLPDRASMRVVLTETLFRSLYADGIDEPEDAVARAVADIEGFDGSGDKPS
jgi:2-hydroxychromene-2-carboxylate isomerase